MKLEDYVIILHKQLVTLDVFSWAFTYVNDMNPNCLAGV